MAAFSEIYIALARLCEYYVVTRLFVGARHVVNSCRAWLTHAYDAKSENFMAASNPMTVLCHVG